MTSTAGLLDLRGGHRAIDFVNTVAWRGDHARRTDHLVDYADLLAWCRHAELISAKEADKLRRAARYDSTAAPREMKRAKKLREALHAVWTGDVEPALATVTTAYGNALGRRELRAGDDGGVAWVDREVTLGVPVDRLAVAAADLLTCTPLDRIRGCGDEACGWLFLDSSHRRNRRSRPRCAARPTTRTAGCGWAGTSRW